MQIIVTDELYHHGILGMHWGVRRYQNEDGTLTEVGKKRYARELKANALKKKENRVSDLDALKDPDRWVKEDITNARDVTSNASKILEGGKEIERLSRKKSINKEDLSTMSDKELRDRINRINMEKQYRELTSSDSTSKGRKIVQGILEYGGAAMGITSAGLGIALSIKKLSGE